MKKASWKNVSVNVVDHCCIDVSQANTRHCPNVAVMLSRCLLLWPNITAALGLVFAGRLGLWSTHKARRDLLSYSPDGACVTES